MGSLLGIDVCDGATDGSMNSDGRLEIVGIRVSGRRDGEIVGKLVVGVGVGEDVMIIVSTGEIVGNLEGNIVGNLEGDTVGDMYWQPSELSEIVMIPSPSLSRQIQPGPYLSAQSRSSSSS